MSLSTTCMTVEFSHPLLVNAMYWTTMTAMIYQRGGFLGGSKLQA